ncbi:MAG: aspartate aminotransferase family protein [Armatimonadetes bacterium]|nr:aspartate aminotransferase family protein [Armatimonadota bacterium]MDE2207046.1 aspartate aminotransferase family protein [Armatimonadota bacterium]
MNREKTIQELSADSFLSEVVGFETRYVARQAAGARIETYTGDRLIDFSGGIAVHACGHSCPEVVAAIVEQAQQLTHTSDTMRHVPQLELGKKITDLLHAAVPGDPWSVLFLNGGSEAIDACAKLALRATGRRKLVAFEGAFHGRTIFATALSRSNRVHWAAYEPFLAALRSDISHAPAPRCAGMRPSEHLTRCDGSCMEGVERILAANGDATAAVFFEAQQGEGGYVPMPRAAADRLAAAVRRHEALLIADEIQCGFGRTGRWFGFEHVGLEPDIVAFGKAIGGGLPLAGVAARRPVMDAWQPGEHGTTFGGNPLACAAGYAALQVIERDRLLERANAVAGRIRAALEPMVGSHGIVDVRGFGLMLGIELRDEHGAPDYARVNAVKEHAREHGLLILSCGARIGSPAVDNACLRLVPPLNIADDALEAGLMILVTALENAVTATAVRHIGTRKSGIGAGTA